MEYSKIGNTDIEVSKLCVGCMSFGKAGTSEEYLGRALKKNIARDKVVIASKVYFNEGRLSKQAIMREIDGSLSRLGTDYLEALDQKTALIGNPNTPELVEMSLTW